MYSYSGIDLYDANMRAIAMADRAIRLNSNLAEPYATRGSALKAITRVSRDSIAVDFERALALRPNSAEIHQWYAHFLTAQGRHQEALAEVQRAITLDPIAPGTRLAFAAVALGARRYDLAVQEADRTTALQPSLRAAREIWALAQLLSGHPDRCAARDLGFYRGLQAMCLHSLGRRAEAARIADSLRIAIANTRHHDSSVLLPMQQLAEYSAWIGDAAASLSWLARVSDIAPGVEDPRNFASGIYDNVKTDPAFRAGLKRIHDKVDTKLLLAGRSLKGL